MKPEREPMATSTTPSLQPITPTYHLKILDDLQLEQMKSATLEILNEAGVHCPSEKVLDIYAEHGAKVNFETQVVKISPQVVLENMIHAPRYFTMGARQPDFDLRLDGKSTYLATDGCGVETIDFVNQQRRSSCKEDVAKMARIADYLTSIGFYWPIVSAQDFPKTAPLHELDASYNNTVKHVQSETIMDAKMAQYALEMVRVIAKDEADLRSRPPLSLLVCCIAPLGLDRDGMESALTLAEGGLPVGFMSMSNVGSTGPATLAGTLVTGDAEIVAAMTLIQMAYPGSPVFHSMMPGIMHPRTGAYLATAWEGTLLYPIGVELAHHWGVPSLAGVFATDGQVPGWQSGGEVASSLLLCALVGAETGSGLGLLESCTLLYPEEVILDVGPRGFFLKHRHTREHMRKRLFSELTCQPAKHGRYRDPLEVAQEKVKWILDNHQPDSLETNQQKELNRILKTADQAFN
jgi:trimethylamine--corrinoid protein Co-methyltransferase